MQLHALSFVRATALLFAATLPLGNYSSAQVCDCEATLSPFSFGGCDGCTMQINGITISDAVCTDAPACQPLSPATCTLMISSVQIICEDFDPDFTYNNIDLRTPCSGFISTRFKCPKNGLPLYGVGVDCADDCTPG